MTAPLRTVDGSPTAIVAWQRDPLRLDDLWIEAVRPGQSIADIIAMAPGLPTRFQRWGEVRIVARGEEWLVPREMWARVRPRTDRPVTIVMVLPFARGGGGNQGKQIGALVAAVALAVVTAGIGSGAILGLTGFAAVATAAAVGVAGSLAINALFATPVSAPQAADQGQDRGAAGASGNVLSPGDAIPFVIGACNVQPALGAYPYVLLSGDDEYAYALFVLSGPHSWHDIRINGTTIEDAEDIDYETREGWDDDAPITLVTKQAFMLTPQLQLSSPMVDQDDQDTLEAPFASALPVFHSFSTRRAPDRVDIHLLFPSFTNQADAADDIAIPFRIRIRRRGTSTWINLPDSHYSAEAARQIRTTISLVWSVSPGSPTNPGARGWYLITKLAPAQTASPASPAWTADSYFSAGSGSNHWYNGGGATNVRNVVLDGRNILFYLDPATFPKDVYEIDIKRGSTYSKFSLSLPGFSYSGNVLDFFSYLGAGQIPKDRGNLTDEVFVSRIVNLWDANPTPTPGLATLAIRARNKNIQNVTALVRKYVPDWDGTGWTDWRDDTSNPAPHFTALLSGPLNPDPLPDELRVDGPIVDWRDECTARGYEVNLATNGEMVADLLTIIAGCGYARLRQADTWSVIYDRDRTAEVPAQWVTPLNSSGFNWSRSFARLPDGFRVRFRDRELDHEFNDIPLIVYREGHEGGAYLEEITYEGIDTRDAAEARATIDLRILMLRATDYSVTMDAENIVCGRGDLIGLVTEQLETFAGYARVKSKVLSGSNITGVVLDAEVPIFNEPMVQAVPVMQAVSIVQKLGNSTGIKIRRRRTDGDSGPPASIHTTSNPTGPASTVTFATPVPDDAAIVADCLAWTGPLASEERRMIVTNIEPAPNMCAALTMVDEAPGILDI